MTLTPEDTVRLAKLDPVRRARVIDSLDLVELGKIDNEFTRWAHDGQRCPPGDWRLWMMIAGRGYGKTRAGAEWIDGLARTRKGGPVRIALVAATIAEARAVMVEGQSGVLSLKHGRWPAKYHADRECVRWPEGSEAFLYSGENPDKLRGPEHHYAWCDELAKWSKPGDSWDMLNMGMRLGTAARMLVTTTPRPNPAMRRLMTTKGLVLTGGPMEDNMNLPDAFKEAMRETYEGTRLGRQELDGELLGDVEGSLWPRDLLERCRVEHAPRLKRVIVGVDPPAGSGPNSDACGIVAVGLGVDGRGYVLGDASVGGARPDGWARAVAGAYHRYSASLILAEKNQGGEMVETVLRTAEPDLPIRLVHAVRGKTARAEPVSHLYERGQVSHTGLFKELEEEMTGMSAAGGYEGPGGSPDRADALVWALTELMLGKVREPGVWVL